MKRVEVTEATGPLAQYAKELHEDALLIMEHGRPLAALVPVGDADSETISLSTNREFMAIIEKSRASLRESGGVSSEEVRRRFGLESTKQT